MRHAGREGKVARWQNSIPSFSWIALCWRARGCNPRKGRDQILPSGNLALPSLMPHSVSLTEGRGVVCSVCSVDCSTNSNGAYVNFVSLEPTFEPSIRPSIVAVVAGREEEGEETARSAQRRMGARRAAPMVFGNVECSVLGAMPGAFTPCSPILFDQS